MEALIPLALIVIGLVLCLTGLAIVGGPLMLAGLVGSVLL